MREVDMNKYYWLRLSQLFWLVPVCYDMCMLLLNSPNMQRVVELLMLFIVGVVCTIFYENKIGKITAWICVGGWFSIVLFFIYGFCRDDNASIAFVFEHMIPSYRIMVILNFTIALCVSLLLIFHRLILSRKWGKILSMIIIVFTLSGSVYSTTWKFYFQDKLVYEKYREGKQLVTKIEDFKNKYGNYPTTLLELGECTDWIYEQSNDGSKYTITDFFEHWHDRCYVGYTTYSAETLSYDSGTREWTHDRP